MSKSKKMSLMVLLLIPVGIAINIIGGQLIALLKLPVYLDAIGTFLVAILAGPIPGVITGFLSNSINAIFAPEFFPYTIVSVVLGLVTGLLSKKGMFKTLGKTLISGLILALLATITASPVTAYVFGGVTGSGSTLLIAALQAGGQELLKATIITSLIVDTVDKEISVFICYLIIKNMSPRYLSKFTLGKQFIDEM